MTDTPQEAPLVVHAQYIKDLSFELPNPLKAFDDSGESPNIEVAVNVSLTGQNGRTHEVMLHIGLNATRGQEQLFVLELDYAGIFTIGASVPEEAVSPMLFIECPRLLFPFARSLVSHVTREAGFAALSLSPIDFVDLYRRQLAEAQKTQENGALTH
jgi:preprotein translocase subunit SecB